MKYTKEANDFSKALGLDSIQVEWIKKVIAQAYNQSWHKDGPNIDQINAFVAPHLKTPEEAFFAAQTIMSDVFGSMMGRG
jgi:hypothetical protein